MRVSEFRLGPGCGRHPDRQHPLDCSKPAELPPVSSIVDCLRWWADRDGERPALYVLDEARRLLRLSSGELVGIAGRIAGGLEQRGVRPGDRVVLCTESPLDTIAGFLGCLWRGALPCISELPVAQRSATAWRERLRDRLRMLDAAAVVVDERTGPLVAEAATERPVVSLRELEAGPGGDAAAVVPEHPAFLQFTSGTVSTGRAICLSHRAVMSNITAMTERARISTDHLFVSWLPLYHDLGLAANLLLALAVGVPIVVMAPMTFLMRPARWLWSIHHFRATTIFAPNFAYEMCVSRVSDGEIAGLDLGSLRDAYNCAEFVQATTLRRFAGKYRSHGFRFDAWRPAYGLAEAVVGVSARPLDRPVRIDRICRRTLAREGCAVASTSARDCLEVVSCGTLFAGHQLAIVDSAGRELPERVQGEIVIAGASLFTGYHGDEAATREVLRDGRYRTGDLGYCVGDELYVCGRSKELLIIGGENHHPHTIERAVAQVEGVRPTVAAIGVPSLALGTELLVVVFETRVQDAGQLHALCDEVARVVHRSCGLRPQRVVPAVPGAFPKTSSGKVQRGRLAAMLDHIDKLHHLDDGAVGWADASQTSTGDTP
jgi:acyl-CoA synthetase (AMP-forming)/AMP-acid ligase II